jgi:hypothetical protein
MILVCGGVAGYVALTAPPPAAEETVNIEDRSRDMQGKYEEMAKLRGTEVPFTDDPDAVREIAATIFDIDLPADFEPIEAKRRVTSSWAVFGKKSESAALLKLAGVNLNGSSLKITDIIPGGVADEKTRLKLVELAENDDGRNDTKLKYSSLKTAPVKRQLTVMGRVGTFEIRQGKRNSDSKPVRKIAGAFRTATGMVALVYMAPEAEFDEEAVVRMIESIRPAPEDEAGRDEDPDPGPAIRKGNPKKSDPD